LPGTNALAYEEHWQIMTVKSYNIGHWGQSFKTIYGLHLRMFAISYSVFPWQAFPGLIIVGKARAYPSKVPLRLGPKRYPQILYQQGTNGVAYHEDS
jgi:hypothetical protein